MLDSVYCLAKGKSKFWQKHFNFALWQQEGLHAWKSVHCGCFSIFSTIFVLLLEVMQTSGRDKSLLSSSYWVIESNFAFRSPRMCFNVPSNDVNNPQMGLNNSLEELLFPHMGLYLCLRKNRSNSMAPRCALIDNLKASVKPIYLARLACWDNTFEEI